MVEKEDKFLKTAEFMKEQYEQAVENQYVESVMAQFIPGAD